MSLADWLPAVADVGALIRTRTRDRSGNELGTFTAETRPTNADVVPIIAGTQGAVLSAVEADDVPLAHLAEARHVTALGAALMVELTYFPEQVATGRSPYEQMKALYDERLTRLRVIVAATSAEEGDETPLSPQFAFPDLVNRVGWESRW